MNFLFLLSRKAVGPVWPAMLLYLTFLAATTLFLVLAHFRSYFKSFTVRELRFLQRLYDATEMVSTLAILTGMIGTCLGLLEVLPVLSESLRADSSNAVLPNVLSPLRNVWVSTIAGLALGGLWGEILMFTLKPYTRPALLPVSHEDPGTTGMVFEEPDAHIKEQDEGGGSEDDTDDDWRQYDTGGIY